MTLFRIISKNFFACCLTAYLFFYQWWSLIFLIPFYIYRSYREISNQKRIRQKKIEEQFRDGLQCLLAALEAGYSMENSIFQAAKDLRTMFGEKEPIVQEFRWMENKLQSGSMADELLLEFGERSGIEDVQNFAGVYAIAKRSGGDVTKVIRSVTDVLYQKHEVMREIQTVLLAKQMEVTVMKVMPYAILLYFQLFSPGFLEPLYQGFGNFIMAIIFLLYRFCCKTAEAFAEIQI